MDYIDKDYYETEYMGEDAGPELDKYIKRASDAIDQVTGYKIKDFDSLAPFVQDQVKKATASQVEYYVIQDGDAEINAGMSDLGRVSIGSFSYGSNSQSSGQEVSRISPNAISFLEPTGLLHRGLDVIENAFY